jgi:hypothetical protein
VLLPLWFLSRRTPTVKERLARKTDDVKAVAIGALSRFAHRLRNRGCRCVDAGGCVEDPGYHRPLSSAFAAIPDGADRQ